MILVIFWQKNNTSRYKGKIKPNNTNQGLNYLLIINITNLFSMREI